MVKRQDFASAHYLGFYHSHQQLFPWNKLTSGKPSLLYEPEQAKKLAYQLTHLQGLEAGILMPSTLHLFWNIFDVLSKQKITIFRDAGSYPISHWGADRAKVRGIKVIPFPHGDAVSLNYLLNKHLPKGYKPIILSDGWCPKCGKLFPLLKYNALAKKFGGYLLVDDTQSLGILGRSPDSNLPYGYGGGGSLAYLDIRDPHIIIGNSLAKAFGAPIAFLGGSKSLIEEITHKSEVRIHCSPPNFAALAALDAAMRRNRQKGDEVRKRLYQNVDLFRSRLYARDIQTRGSFFPVQSISNISKQTTGKLYAYLKRQNIHAVLIKSHRSQPMLTFIIRADHSHQDLKAVTTTISNFLNKVSLHRKKNDHELSQWL